VLEELGKELASGASSRAAKGGADSESGGEPLEKGGARIGEQAALKSAGTKKRKRARKRLSFISTPREW